MMAIITVTGKNRESIADNLEMLANEIRTGFEDNGRGHFGRDGFYDFSLLTSLEKEE